ncbi:right-handed parallel beta-helix repeat-containing protein [Candidatus Woesearchaeota archaeon]|jgi:hypothetical protein|nr:right-handed parallel beta-helix repeat-containing protein [Candidatus Woesearchaeota archaeon]
MNVKIVIKMLTFIWIILLIIPISSSKILYLDNMINSECLNSYSIENRDCNGNDGDAYNIISNAVLNINAGDIIYFRQGSYFEQLKIDKSGEQNNYIVFSNYNNELVEITGLNLRPAIDISNTEYIDINGLKINEVTHWLYAVNTQHAIIENNYFGKAIDSGHSQKTGLFFQEANYNKIINNTFFDNDEDSLALIKSNHNLVQSNNFTKAWHTLWTIKCGSYNIIRNNYFHNEEEKIGEVFDCDDVGFNHEFNNILNSTKRNLVEQNIFAYTPTSGDSSPYSGIQYAGQEGIIRNNLFYNTVGPGLSLTLYANEAKYNLKNRIYNNVFYSTDFAGISLSGASYDFYDNVLKNNLLSKSNFIANDQRWSWYTEELDGKSIQLISGRLDGFKFHSNNLYSDQINDDYLITYGKRDHSNNPVQHNVEWWESNYVELFKNNKQNEPIFQSEQIYDFHLKGNSPMIDAGEFLTFTTNSGIGDQIQVGDTLYFFDGFDIQGEHADIIQLENNNELAYILDIDHDNNMITIDRSLIWENNLGVSLPYSGNNVDIGAFEFDPNYEIPTPIPCEVVTKTELLNNINECKKGNILILELFNIIYKWKNNCS